jgi:hypothetical protein
VRTRLSTARRHGWIEEQKLGRGRTAVRLTARGLDVATRWKTLAVAAEADWRKQAGGNDSDRLRDSLQELVAALPLEHPHYPAGYGPADASITGGNGVDWKPVPRSSRDSVSDLSLAALISQLLVAFAIDYEQKSPVALSLSMSIVMRIPADGRPLRGMGHSAGVSALVRHGFLRLGDAQGETRVHLTPRGNAVQAAHEKRIQEVETEWSHRFGAESIASLRLSLENVLSAKAR